MKGTRCCVNFNYSSSTLSPYMNRVKTPKRSRLNDERTSDFTLLSHEKELFEAIDIAGSIDKFAERNRRVLLN